MVSFTMSSSTSSFGASSSGISSETSSDAPVVSVEYDAFNKKIILLQKELEKFSNNLNETLEIDTISPSIDELKIFLNNLSYEELLNKIKYYQNESSKHQAETNHLVISLGNLIFAEKESKDPFWINHLSKKINHIYKEI